MLFRYTFLTSHWNRRAAVVSVKPHYFNSITLKAVWFDDWEVIPTVYFVQHLRFSQWCCRGFRSLGTWRRVAGWAAPNSLKDCGALGLWLLHAEAEGARVLQNVGSCVPQNTALYSRRLALLQYSPFNPIKSFYWLLVLCKVTEEEYLTRRLFVACTSVTLCVRALTVGGFLFLFL